MPARKKKRSSSSAAGKRASADGDKSPDRDGDSPSKGYKLRDLSLSRMASGSHHYQRVEQDERTEAQHPEMSCLISTTPPATASRLPTDQRFDFKPDSGQWTLHTGFPAQLFTRTREEGGDGLVSSRGPTTSRPPQMLLFRPESDVEPKLRRTTTPETPSNPPLISDDSEVHKGFYWQAPIDLDSIKNLDVMDRDSPFQKVCLQLSKIDVPPSSFPTRLIPYPTIQHSDPVQHSEPVHTPDDPLQNLQTSSSPTHSVKKDTLELEPTEKEPTPPKRPRSKWTEEKEQILCQLWEKEPLLYDAKHPNHRRTPKRKEAYERIAALLDMDAESVEKRMNSLRTVYRKLVLSKAAFQPELMTVTQQKIVSMCGFLLTHLQSLAESEILPETSMEAESTEPSHQDEHIHTKQYQEDPSASKPKISTGVKDTADFQMGTQISASNPGVLDFASGPIPETCDNNYLWARLLAEKMKLMDPLKCEEFKVTVDSLALNVLKKSKMKES